MSSSGLEGRATLWTSGGSVLSALVASACCWLPLALLLFGVSAAGVAATFERIRPAFLLVSALLLGAGFYLNYFRKPRCEPGSECARPNPRLTRFNRSVLWLATGAVLAFALFPNYIGALVGTDSEILDDSRDSQTVLNVSGMTCTACELTLETALERVPGVANATMSYSEGRALVTLDPNAPATMDALVESVENAGYGVKLDHPSEDPGAHKSSTRTP